MESTVLHVVVGLVTVALIAVFGPVGQPRSEVAEASSGIADIWPGINSVDESTAGGRCVILAETSVK